MGEVFELRADEFEARIDRTGAGLQALTWRGHDVVWPYTGASGPVAYQGQVLAPWPNRVSDGTYRFAGSEHRLDVNEASTGSAIHGLVFDRKWSPDTVSEDAATLRLDFGGTPGFPFPMEFVVTYRLDGAGLTVTTTARNRGEGPAPFGLAFHPYLTLGRPLGELAERGALTLEVPADTYQPVDERLLPNGPPVPVGGTGFDFRAPGRNPGDTVLDTAFSTLARDDDGLARVRLSGPEHRVVMWCDSGFGWLQLFSSDTLDGPHHRAYLAAEPTTCPPDALTSGTDLIVLAPGGITEHTFGITAAPLG